MKTFFWGGGGMTLLFLAEICRVVAQKEYVAVVATDDSEEISDL
jgi:hypothetical protein